MTGPAPTSSPDRALQLRILAELEREGEALSATDLAQRLAAHRENVLAALVVLWERRAVAETVPDKPAPEFSATDYGRAVARGLARLGEG